MNNLWILAAADGEDVATSQPQALPTGDETPITNQGTKAGGSPLVDGEELPPVPFYKNPGVMMLIFMLMIMYLFMIRGPKKKQQQHTNMVKSLKKNDKICTIGGIYGTVIEVREKDIIIKIDESNNTKIKVTPGAVRNIAAAERENK